MQKRLIFTDLDNPYVFKDFEKGVYAIIGPFAGHASDPEFQDELTLLCRRYNKPKQSYEG